MHYELIALAVSCLLLLLVLIRISLTLNEISASLRKLARRKSEQSLAIASTVLHEGEAFASVEPIEPEIAAAIAIARSELDHDRALK